MLRRALQRVGSAGLWCPDREDVCCRKCTDSRAAARETEFVSCRALAQLALWGSHTSADSCKRHALDARHV